MTDTKTQEGRGGKAKCSSAPSGFSVAERAAMKERAKELKAQALKSDGESAALAKIGEMPASFAGEPRGQLRIACSGSPLVRRWAGLVRRPRARDVSANRRAPLAA